MADIAADDGKTTPKKLFVGRDKEINEILDLKTKKGTRLLLRVGASLFS